MRIGALSAFQGKGRNPTPSAPAPDYEQTLRNISGLVGLWMFDETSGTVITDGVGGLNGTYVDAVVLGDTPIPADTVRAVNFDGVGSGTIPHGAALALSALTLSVWFRAHAIPMAEARYVVVAKDATGLVNGDTTILIEDDGTLKVQMNAGAGSLQIQNFPTIVLEQSYNIILRADNTGFDAYLNGAYLGKNTGHTAAWVNNTKIFEIAQAEAFPAALPPADISMSSMAVWNRVITEAEVLVVAQQTEPPTAADDLELVPESATTSLNVLVNDTYVGTPTLSIVAQPAGGDSVAVNGLLIDYTAVAVSSDTVRSFQYEITDPNGVSNTATVTVTVQNSPPPNPSELETICYVNGGDEVNAATAAALQAAINGAPPGRNILVTADLAAANLTLTPAGTLANPIVVRSSTGALRNVAATSNWSINGTGLVLRDLAFHNIRMSIGNNSASQYIRITRNTFDTVGGHSISVFGAMDCRIDHNDFSDYLNNTALKSFIRLNEDAIGNGTMQRLLIDYNYFHDISVTSGNNGMEPVGLQASSGGAWGVDARIIVDHCLFRNYSDLVGDREMLGSKSPGWILRFSTWENTGPNYIQWPRQGEDMECRSCWFENTRSPPIHVFSRDGLIIGNRFVGNINLTVMMGTATRQQTIDEGGPSPNYYMRAEDARLIGNILDTGTIRIGHPYSDGTLQPLGTILEANIRNGVAATVASGGVVLLSGSLATISPTTAEPFVAAVKLLPADVGINAPDTACPLGPQT